MSFDNDTYYLFIHLRRRGYKVSKEDSLRVLINVALIGIDEAEASITEMLELQDKIESLDNEIAELKEKIDNYPGPAYC